MAVVTIKEIAAQFNSTITDLMSKGYIISPFTMNGSYSNTRTHVDMINPRDTNHVIRVWMVDESASVPAELARWRSWIDVVGVRVKKYTKSRCGRGYDGNFYCEQTLWPGEDYGEVVSEKLFYAFSERKGRKAFTDNFDEAKQLLELNYNRYLNRRTDNKDVKQIPVHKLSANFIDLIMARINSVRGFKRATASCIEQVLIGKSYNDKLVAEIKYEFNGKHGMIHLR